MWVGVEPAAKLGVRGERRCRRLRRRGQEAAAAGDGEGRDAAAAGDGEGREGRDVVGEGRAAAECEGRTRARWRRGCGRTAAAFGGVRKYF